MEAIDQLVDSAFGQTKGRLVRLPDDRPVVFIGDVHGDLDAVRRVVEAFPQPEYVLVFLGDLVDRGPDSEGVLRAVAEARLKADRSVHLLMGNHEAWAVQPFRPADFWERLAPETAQRLADALRTLPFAAWHPAGLLAVHGAPPDLPALDAMSGVEPGSEPWRAMTWGDLSEEFGARALAPVRPMFGRAAFETRTDRLGARVVVRSHQPFAPQYQFDDRCLTLFTSSAYGRGPRQVALLPPGRSTRTARDLELIGI